MIEICNILLADLQITRELVVQTDLQVIEPILQVLKILMPRYIHVLYQKFYELDET